MAYNPATGSTQLGGPPAPVFNSGGSPTRGISSGVGASAPLGFSNAGVGPASAYNPTGYGSGGIGKQTPGLIGTQTHGYMGTQTPGYMGTQTPGYMGTQTPGYTGTQTPGYMGTQTPGYMGTQTPGYAGMHAGGQIQGVMMPPGVQHYQPSANASAQPLGYKSGRAYLPAYSTSPERPAGRIYYPSSGGIPAPPPPPPPPHMGSPGPRVTYLPVSPIATGTPLSKRSANEGSMTVPPSPIGKLRFYLK